MGNKIVHNFGKLWKFVNKLSHKFFGCREGMRGLHRDVECNINLEKEGVIRLMVVKKLSTIECGCGNLLNNYLLKARQEYECCKIRLGYILLKKSVDNKLFPKFFWCEAGRNFIARLRNCLLLRAVAEINWEKEVIIKNCP